MVLHIDSWFKFCCKEEMSEHLDIVLKHLVSSANKSVRLEPIQTGRSFM